MICVRQNPSPGIGCRLPSPRLIDLAVLILLNIPAADQSGIYACSRSFQYTRELVLLIFGISSETQISRLVRTNGVASGQYPKRALRHMGGGGGQTK